MGFRKIILSIGRKDLRRLKAPKTACRLLLYPIRLGNEKNGPINTENQPMAARAEDGQKEKRGVGDAGP